MRPRRGAKCSAGLTANDCNTVRDASGQRIDALALQALDATRCVDAHRIPVAEGAATAEAPGKHFAHLCQRQGVVIAAGNLDHGAVLQSEYLAWSHDIELVAVAKLSALA